LKSLTPISRKRVEVVLQNGEVREISGVGYNDVGSKIKILDPEMGQIDLDWNKIESIEFIKTPAKLIDNFGEALYGVVETDEGSFTGFVQWDHDERLSTDKLDGDTYDGDVSIPFGKLQSITKIGSSRCDVQLQSGRSFELRGSNDVDSGNRGVIVTIKGLGRVDIPWRSFRKVTFKPAPKASPTYDSFKTQQILKGQVITSKGESLKGKLIFDLDEEYNYEILQGEQEDIEYLIPFRNIERIKPKNYNHSMVFLKNGDELILEESQDVTDKNTGILVFAGKNDPIYIPWEHVEQVKFE
ncbi:MAG: hypothetical protein KI790_11130, partial [Cyclobacteriaceae bacterium]|nr:hypothetical protein [Cyclobacteriaceae bacterium HetDA_MAG_MS6]